MNGRIYDPALGRFLSADPFVGDVGDSQEYNRYSYVGNNPMNATDPSGYLKLKDLFMVSHYSNPAYWLFPNAYKQYEPMLRGIVVTAVLTYATWGIGAPLAGAAGGAVSGFESSLLNGGSIGDAFKSGVIGGVIGGATAYISGAIGNTFGAYGDYGVSGEIARAALHGTVSGGVTEAMGGEFRHGFYAGAAGSLFGGAANFGGDDLGSVMARTAVAAVVGGTASAIGGGKFANGAITAAFQHMFNAEAHRGTWQKFKDGAYFGTGYGEDAAEYYAQITLDPNASGLAKAGAWVGGVWSSLWMRDTYLETTTILATGAGVARGYTAGREKVIKSLQGSANKPPRVAPFGNRTGHPTGRYPHYHRAVPNSKSPGNSLPGQSINRHRPWDSSPMDKSFWDRF